MRYEMVIGLETHVELATKTKMFCSCSTAFGAEPNSQCCPGCGGLPGTLPALNKHAVELAVMAGLALNCDIQTRSIMERKHYFYPDLPRAYQISQVAAPICIGGYMDLSNGRRIRLTRIHIEEDAGKLVRSGGEVRMDNNRGGIGLIEIVTEPDFRSIDEVLEYMERLQTTLRAVGVSDCRMQEGRMRCDVNMSLRLPGETRYGVRTETKNLNSFTTIAAAIDFEYDRQSDALDNGVTLVQETRGFDFDAGESVSLRSKENADDYRYFTDPDLIRVIVPPDEIERLRAELPELPDAKLRRYVNELSVAESDAKLLTKYRAVSEYFERASEGISAKSAATFITSTMFADITTEAEREFWNPAVTSDQLNELLALTESGKINKNTQKRVYQQMSESGKPASAFLTAEDTETISPERLAELCSAAIAANERSVTDYKSGKTKALQALIGAVMRETRGRADASAVESLLVRLLRG